MPTATDTRVSLRTRIAGFRHDRNGVAAVEFALILPFLLTIYIGVYEACSAINASRKVAATSESIGDIVARSTQMGPQRIENVYAVASAMMIPLPHEDMKITVTAIKVDQDGKAVVSWSKSNEGAGLAEGASLQMPPSLRSQKDTFVIQTSVDYAYSPMFTYGDMFGDMTFAKTSYYRPRRVTEIKWDESE